VCVHLSVCERMINLKSDLSVTFHLLSLEY